MMNMHGLLVDHIPERTEVKVLGRTKDLTHNPNLIFAYYTEPEVPLD
jgi:hypothetical protein